MTKIKCPYKYPLKSREAMVGYIEDVGGYTTSCHDKYPLVWNVKAHCDTGFDALWDCWMEDGDNIPDEVKNDETAREAYRKLAQACYDDHDDYEWFDWGLEDAQRSFTEDDCFTTLWDGTEVRAEWTLTGRSGGYAALKEFDGHRLYGMTYEALVEELALTGEDEEWSFADVRKLYKFCVEMNSALTPKNAAREVQYRAAFTLFCNFVEHQWTPEYAAGAWLTKLFENTGDQDTGSLDEVVHEYKSAEAAEINNNGPAAQITYLLNAGRDAEDIAEDLGIDLPDWAME